MKNFLKIVFGNAQTCNIYITSFEGNEPAILIRNQYGFAFARPSNGILTFSAGQEFFLVCTSDGTYRPKTCNPAEVIKILPCRKANSVSAVKKEIHCCGPIDENHPRGVGSLYHIGIQVPTQKDQFAILYYSCQNNETHSVYFAQEFINQGRLNGVMLSGKTFAWDKFGYGKISVPLESNNKITYGSDNNPTGQLRRFKEIFNEDLNKAKRYINFEPKKSELYLAKGHLCPHANQPFDTWRKATYFYLNHVPQWQKINNGAWSAVEGYVRSLTTYRNLIITTGGYDQLIIENHATSMVNLNNVTIPKYVWKIIQNNHNP
ncbi:hypothetical protein PVAND_006243 [Polypedilum vanderplanki]|uniref:DNA/RNA non-specific endonuclease/pyrophosphatase/phosphodiesterase domain-containing protein n=1 Tax=Polypedilum vanderplanki TaxID=319348 RepID=A0A9J6C3D9_POLVA|nr:hypothetical protein PVAND_006243 [Polypedilum vanderplanki]